MTPRLGWAASRALTPSVALRAAALPAAALLVLTACTSNAPSDSTKVSVDITASECAVSAATAPAGSVVFTVTNDGDAVAEFYVYQSNGTSIVAEVENIGPGLSRDLVVALSEGTYITACDPGMDGDELRADFVATAAGASAAAVSPEKQAALAQASADYVAYVQGEVDTLATKTQAFADAFAAGDDELARSLYADARVHWERIEPVAESFGDLDPKLDLREADLGPQELWTGWHHAEKVLWPPAEGYTVDDALRASLADQLVADTLELQSRVTAADFTIEPFQIGNGAKELLDEVATTKITGEEEIWSGTDLWDIQANIDGARKSLDVLRPVVAESDPELLATLDERFDAVQALLDAQGSLEDGFAYYPELTDAEVLELSRAIDALAEPLALLTAAAVL